MPFLLFSNLQSLLTVGSWVTSKLDLNVYLAELSEEILQRGDVGG